MKQNFHSFFCVSIQPVTEKEKLPLSPAVDKLILQQIFANKNTFIALFIVAAIPRTMNQ